MGGITTKMKRIIDLDKLQGQRQKKQKTYWQRIKKYTSTSSRKHGVKLVMKKMGFTQDLQQMA
jgi:hypothetical protein